VERKGRGPRILVSLIHCCCSLVLLMLLCDIGIQQSKVSRCVRQSINDE
jgi:hypothetical protein